MENNEKEITVEEFLKAHPWTGIANVPQYLKSGHYWDVFDAEDGETIVSGEDLQDVLQEATELLNHD